MSLLDRFRSSPAPPTAPVGASGRHHFSGFLDLEELNVDLRGRAGLRVFDEMYRTDADCRRSIAMVCNPITGGTWSLEPYGQDDATDLDKQIVEDVHWWLFEVMSPNLKEHLSEAVPLFARSGFTPFEMLWEVVEHNGRQFTLPTKLDLRLPRSIYRWFEDERSELLAIEQLITWRPNVVQLGLKTGFVRIEADNLVYYRIGAEGDNWEGVSLLRPAYKHWYIKDNVERLDAIAQEREATGIPTIYPPAGFTDDTVLNDVLEQVAGMRAGEETAIMMPGPRMQAGVDAAVGWELDIIGLGAAGSGGTRSAEATLNYHGDKIAAAVIAEFMRLGHKNTGARATSDTQQNPFHAGVEAVSGIPERALKHMIERFVALNYPNAEGAPRLVMEKADSTSLQELETYVAGLVAAGVMQADEPLEDFLREKADLPPADTTVRAQKRQQDQEDRQHEVVSRQQALEQAQQMPPDQVAKAKVAHGIVPGDSFNWVEQAGGLPRKIHELVDDLKEKGRPEDEAVPIAVEAAKRFCAAGHSDWCDAVAEWESKKARHSGAGSDEYLAESFARQERALRHYEENMSLDTIEQAISGARDQFQQGAGPHVYALAARVCSQLLKGDDPDTDTSDLEGELYDQLAALYRTGRVTVSDELNRQRQAGPTTSFADPSNVPAAIRQRAQAAAEAIFAGILRAARRLVVAGRHPAASIQAAAETAGMQTLRAEAMVHAAPALNLGRSDEADAHADEIAGTFYTSILDANRCEHCAQADDDVMRPMSDPVRLHRKPPNPDCYGGERCRCMEAYVLGDETSPSA